MTDLVLAGMAGGVVGGVVVLLGLGAAAIEDMRATDRRRAARRVTRRVGGERIR